MEPNYSCMHVETSVVLRVKNEEKYLPQVLTLLSKQTYTNFEIIVVNDNSTDRTVAIAAQYDKVRIINLKPGSFTYAHASNIGVHAARGKYIVLLSGHSIPISTTWLADGLRHFVNQQVAGVYAVPMPMRQHIWEYLFFSPIVWIKFSRYEVVQSDRLGLMGSTNAIYRKDLLQQFPFDEQCGGGGEEHMYNEGVLERGYDIIHDPKFRVRHSHNLNPIQILGLLKRWRRSGTQQMFRAKARNF